MAVVITSTGGVAKRVVTFDHAVDPGLAKWAGEYLNERVAGLQLGTSRLRRELEDSSLSGAEREFLAACGLLSRICSRPSSGSTWAALRACSTRGARRISVCTGTCW